MSKWLLAIYICSHILRLSKTYFCYRCWRTVSRARWAQTWKSLFPGWLRESEHTNCFARETVPASPPPSARRHNSGLHTGNDCHLRKDTGKNGLKKYSGQSKNTLKYFHLNCKMLKRSLTNLSNTWQNIESLFEISFWYITNSCEGVGWLEK